MAILRFSALQMAQSRQPKEVKVPASKISEFYGSHVFYLHTAEAYLSSANYKRLCATIESGEKIDVELADAVASAMKTWAVERGVTHFTHWFQPLRGTTAEKHDSFFELNNKGQAIERFKGGELIKQEPDASSFPSGGLRNTFEARGYTAWDSSSPAFIHESGSIKTLCVPSIFVSYTGVALDYKTPLLKSLDLLNKAATAVCQYFDKEVTKVTATLGIEQEYFLVDKALAMARPDLVLCGRTIFGHSPARGQQLSDHYFGSIPLRVKSFMQDFENEALKLGIPVRTRHNEVAPSQYECAPLFEEVNLAVDHNSLLMDVMNRVAEAHDFKILFHEKPFAGINGSGKHNNWSLQTNTGRNLLAPSSKPKENLQFLVFFVNVIKAVHTYADLMRAGIATASNDFRLGGHEAPPAIMSVFIGKQLSSVLDELEKNATLAIGKGENMYMKLGIDKVPPILLDNTDRNRTSPFAFTGNKFEFRAVGSSANSANPMMILNSIVADQLMEFHKEVESRSKDGQKRELVIIDILRDYIRSSKAIRFEGDGYSEEWAKEAQKRGLKNIKNSAHALEIYGQNHIKALFSKLGIFSEIELEARQEIEYDKYVLQVQIESRLINDLAQSHIVPAALAYQNRLAENIKHLRDLGLEKEAKERMELLQTVSGHISTILKNSSDMLEARKKANVLDTKAAALAYCDKVKPYFDKIRKSVDELELLIDDELWTLPKYRELLFIK
ncbi:MAG: glutamine synthetase type III [Cytophagales bacterium]|nr:MAG: glutamine synthetase type III [Cytophagales bacterium]TAF60013.1 MAG: glutamine synthetase type III [Cytophagales bacterium]